MKRSSVPRGPDEGSGEAADRLQEKQQAGPGKSSSDALKTPPAFSRPRAQPASVPSRFVLTPYPVDKPPLW